MSSTELFDAAFKEYAERWAFKHPKPADFFRTMEDASAVDLDWFWKGWFYTIDHVDVSVENVKWFRVKDTTEDPEKKKKKVFRVKYTCPKCGANAWAKPAVKLVCGVCEKRLQVS